MTVTVASAKKAMTTRESPGIITLITAQEIANSGARDFIDILRLVPGFYFGMDVQGVVGLGMRGNWVHEGKILLMIDGQEMNELSYATLQFGNHYPVDNISRIEIIRGPGSAIYGGFAELGVINVITKKGEQIDGFAASVLASKMSDGDGRRNIMLTGGKKDEDLEWSVSLFAGQGSRSDRDFSDFYDTTYNMDNNSDLDPTMLNLSVSYKDLSLRFLADGYEMMQRDLFFISTPFPIDEDFPSIFVEAKYDFTVNEKLTITPTLNYKKQKPWFSNSAATKRLNAIEEDGEQLYAGQLNTTGITRKSANVLIFYDLNENYNIVGGATFYEDDSTVSPAEEDLLATADSKYDSKAIFAQGMFTTDIANFTVGARAEKHSFAGNSFVPRVGVTKVWDKLHTKLLITKAFRAPVVQNIINRFDKTDSIDPENTTVIELEAGYIVSSNLFVTANIYSIKIEDPIVYFYDSEVFDSYRNYDQVTTRGIEIESKYKASWGYLNASLSTYTVGDNKVDQYAVQDVNFEVIDEDVLLGFPTIKFTLNGSIRLADNITLNPSLIYMGKKWGYTAADADDSLVAEELDAVSLLNINLSFDKVLHDDLAIHIGAYNLADEEIDYVQPYYDGYHAPLPGPSREIYLKASYRL